VLAAPSNLPTKLATYSYFVPSCLFHVSTDSIPVHQENAEDLSGDGHWFIVVVNMKARMFQVIDSLRNPDDMMWITKCKQGEQK
jgi:hypothetical protein